MEHAVNNEIIEEHIIPSSPTRGFETDEKTVNIENHLSKRLSQVQSIFPSQRPSSWYTQDTNGEPRNVPTPRPFESFYDPEAAQAAGWSKGYEDFQKRDAIMIKDYDEGMNALLVFAGLFSAVVTAFIVEVSKSLQEDPASASVVLLTRITAQLQSPIMNELPPLPPKYSPSASAIAVISLWYSSLALSIFTSLFAIYVKQWLRKYGEWEKEAVHMRAIITRGFYFQGLDDWHVADIVAGLPVLLQLSLLLFTFGLLTYLWTINNIVAAILSAQVTLFLTVVVMVTILPTFFPNCPYRTPFGYFWLIIAIWLARSLEKIVIWVNKKPSVPSDDRSDTSSQTEIMSKPRFFMLPNWRDRTFGPTQMVVQFERTAHSTASMASFLLGTPITSLLSLLELDHFRFTRVAYRIKSLPEDLSRQLIRRIFVSRSDWVHNKKYSIPILRLLGLLSLGEPAVRWEGMITLMSLLQDAPADSLPEVLLSNEFYREVSDHLCECADSRRLPATITKPERDGVTLAFLEFALPLRKYSPKQESDRLEENDQILYNYAWVATELFALTGIEARLNRGSQSPRLGRRGGSSDVFRPNIAMFRRKYKNSQSQLQKIGEYVGQFFEEAEEIRDQMVSLQSHYSAMGLGTPAITQVTGLPPILHDPPNSEIPRHFSSDNPYHTSPTTVPLNRDAINQYRSNSPPSSQRRPTASIDTGLNRASQRATLYQDAR